MSNGLLSDGSAMSRLLLGFLFLLSGCAKFETSPGDLKDSLPSASQPPLNVPGAVSIGSWTGLMGLSTSDLQGALNGSWATSCVSSMILTENFAAGFVNQTTFSYGTADCSGPPIGSTSVILSVVYGGTNGAIAEGYDINIGIGTMSAPYQIIKINSSGTLMALGFASGLQDGTTNNRRPISWFPLSFLRQ